MEWAITTIEKTKYLIFLQLGKMISNFPSSVIFRRLALAGTIVRWTFTSGSSILHPQKPFMRTTSPRFLFRKASSWTIAPISCLSGLVIHWSFKRFLGPLGSVATLLNFHIILQRVVRLYLPYSAHGSPVYLLNHLSKLSSSRTLFHGIGSLFYALNYR